MARTVGKIDYEASNSNKCPRRRASRTVRGTYEEAEVKLGLLQGEVASGIRNPVKRPDPVGGFVRTKNSGSIAELGPGRFLVGSKVRVIWSLASGGFTPELPEGTEAKPR